MRDKGNLVNLQTMAKLTDAGIRALLESLDGWILHAGRLEKTYAFTDFSRAVLFLNQAVNPIEELALYPGIRINYNRVSVSIQTPEAGALTDNDAKLARALDAIKN